MNKEKCKVCGAKGYHKLSCSNNVNRPKKLNVDIKLKKSLQLVNNLLITRSE
jgi:hypothetical protein